MKALFILALPTMVFASPCEVGGISDSPQRMECYISHMKIRQKLLLRCTNGRYQLHWYDRDYEIKNAYHLDVETGSSPLVFESAEMTLTTVSKRVYSSALLETGGKSFSGLCFDQK